MSSDDTVYCIDVENVHQNLHTEGCLRMKNSGCLGHFFVSLNWDLITKQNLYISVYISCAFIQEQNYYKHGKIK
jgi:hypothetical protein